MHKEWLRSAHPNASLQRVNLSSNPPSLPFTQTYPVGKTTPGAPGPLLGNPYRSSRAGHRSGHKATPLSAKPLQGQRTANTKPPNRAQPSGPETDTKNWRKKEKKNNVRNCWRQPRLIPVFRGRVSGRKMHGFTPDLATQATSRHRKAQSCCLQPLLHTQHLVLRLSVSQRSVQHRGAGMSIPDRGGNSLFLKKKGIQPASLV